MGPDGPSPTVAEQAWLRAITAFGCVACHMDQSSSYRPAAVHHICVAGRRLGHRFTLPLCDPGHHQNGGRLGLISLHPGVSKRFTQAYGTELSLLARLERKLGFPHAEPPMTKAEGKAPPAVDFGEIL